MAAGKLLPWVGLLVGLVGLAGLIVIAGMRQSVKSYLYRDLAQVPA